MEVGGEEVTGELRKLHNEKLHDFYPSPDTVKIIEACGRYGGEEKLWWGNLKED